MFLNTLDNLLCTCISAKQLSNEDIRNCSPIFLLYLKRDCHGRQYSNTNDEKNDAAD